MVGLGLSVVLEPQNDVTQKSPQVINKPMFIKPSSPTPLYTRWKPSTFLDYCFLCKQKLLPGKDIYMYKGDKAFCCEECRCRQIFMDEEETIKRDNCSLAVMTMRSRRTESSSSASSSNAGNRKGTRNRANGFAC